MNEMESESTNNNPDTEIKDEGGTNLFAGYSNMEQLTAAGFKLLGEAIKNSNKLPFGRARDLYESYPSFHNLVKDETNNVLSKLSSIMKHAGCRGNILRRDHEEKFEMIVEANDIILERVGITLDEIAGIRSNPEPELQKKLPARISGSWNKHIINERSTPQQALNTILIKTKNIEKPQIHFKDKVNNDRNVPFEPRIKNKYNLLKPLALFLEEDESGVCQYSHPYEFELERFEPPIEQLKSVEPKMYDTLENTPLHLISTVDGVNSMLSDLKKYKEIAVDLEHHSYRSFQGFTCLMQLSTRDADYIVDTLVLRNDLEILNEVFTDPSVVKIFHGADMDIQWLQRDLSLYVVNMFDTHQACKLLNYPQLSLAYLLKHFCKVDAQKHFQLADWRIRPLPDELLSYAREDTHYLLYIYDNMKNQLIEKANGETNLLQSVISESRRICLTRYIKPIWSEDGYLNMYHRSKRFFDNRQQYALKHLYEWRDITAREQDESTGYVLPNHMMLHISEALPREIQGILACCNPIPTLVRQNLNTLHQIILKAREQPLVKQVFEERRLYRSTAENDLTPDNPLRCPHDLNHDMEFRDDLPTLLKNKLDKSLLTDSKLLKTIPVIDIFDKLMKSAWNKPEKADKSTHLTPYQRYKLVKPFADSEETVDTEANEIISSNKDKIEKMEIDAVQSIIKKEDKPSVEIKKEKPQVKEPSVSLKRKVEEEKEAKSNKKPKKNVRRNNRQEIIVVVENPDAVPKPTNDSDIEIVHETSEGNPSDFKPFDYSSVNYKEKFHSGIRRKQFRKNNKKFNKNNSKNKSGRGKNRLRISC